MGTRKVITLNATMHTRSRSIPEISDQKIDVYRHRSCLGEEDKEDVIVGMCGSSGN